MSFKLFLLIAFFSLAEAQNETNVEGSGATDGIINVILVTQKSFDPSKNKSNARIVKDSIDSYSKDEGIKYPSDNIQQKIKNHAGKFAIEYIIDDAECEQVKKFIKGAKNHSNEVAYAILTCPGMEINII